MHDVYLVGAGIYSTLHFTTEARQILSVCKQAFCLLDDTDVIEFVRALGPDTVDLLDIYDLALLRSEIYDRISGILIEAASSGRGPVALVTHGHPLFLVSASERIIHRAESAGLSVGIVSGVSSFDTLMTDLREDFGYGFQAYDATNLIAEDHPINTAVPLLIFQVANTLCFKPQASPPDIAILEPLLGKLRAHYPAGHRITFITSPTRLLDLPERKTVGLSDDDDLRKIELWKRPTIYVEPL